MILQKPFSAAWRFLSGKKVWIAAGGYALEAAGYLIDKPEIIAMLPKGSQGALNGALAVLMALGVLHKADRAQIAEDK